MITMRYHQLVGKTVIAADGQIVGRVADLMAEQSGDALVVTALLVGPRAFLRRLGLRAPWSDSDRHPCGVPWQAVERIDERIHLRLPRATVAAMRHEPLDADAAGSG
jgi:sporulation protein YlmC with PRC-barrel domain